MAREYTDAEIINGLTKAKGLVYIAASKIGCTAQTIYNRIKASPEVKRCVDEARGRLVDSAEGKLATAVTKGEKWAVMYTLSTLGKSRGYVVRQELTGADGEPIRFVAGLDDDDDSGQGEA